MIEDRVLPELPPGCTGPLLGYPKRYVQGIFIIGPDGNVYGYDEDDVDTAIDDAWCRWEKLSGMLRSELKNLKACKQHLGIVLDLVDHPRPEPPNHQCGPEGSCDIGCIDFASASEKMREARKCLNCFNDRNR